MSELLKHGKFDKFTVLKNEDINDYVSDEGKRDLKEICECISGSRVFNGKTATNKYLVINVDELYVVEIIEILKRNGHWG
jgi:hypothetical protein